MWERQRLTAIWTSTTYYKDTFLLLCVCNCYVTFEASCRYYCMYCTVPSPFMIVKTRLAATESPLTRTLFRCLVLYSPFYRCKVQSEKLSFLFVFLLCSQKPMTRTFLRQATETSVASRKPIFAFSFPAVAPPTGHIAFRCDAGHLPTVHVFRFGHSQQNAQDML
jgi:hypothetical protein